MKEMFYEVNSVFKTIVGTELREDTETVMVMNVDLSLLFQNNLLLEI